MPLARSSPGASAPQSRSTIQPLPGARGRPDDRPDGSRLCCSADAHVELGGAYVARFNQVRESLRTTARLHRLLSHEVRAGRDARRHRGALPGPAREPRPDAPIGEHRQPDFRLPSPPSATPC